MIKIFNSILLLFLLVPQIVQPFASFYLLEKGDKQVLLLGDAHNPGLQELNSRHLQALKSTVSKYSKVTQINYFIELNISEFNHVVLNKNYMDPENILVQMISAKETFFNLVPADARSLKSYASCFHKIASYLQRQNQSSFKLSELQKIIDEYKASKENISLKQYIDNLNKNAKRAQILLACYESSEYYQLMDDSVKQFIESINILKSEFGSYNVNKSFGEFIIDSVKSNDDLEDIARKFRSLYATLCKPDALYADLFFLDSVLKDQKKSNKSVLAAGNAHILRLVTFFEQLDYKVKSHSSCAFSNNDGFSKSVEHGTVFDEKLCETTKQFLADIIAPSLASSSSIASVAKPNENKCNFCTKKSTNQAFKQCSACKQVHYCSPKCQQYDWEFHKNICNYVTGKHKLALITPIELDKNNE
ncbi:MAG: zinc finger MYND domain-containing protein [Candidatus Babeliales bacterium]|nr:zinc finger MYND domain-containing protein [Candidatus Babeliales bacterium]